MQTGSVDGSGYRFSRHIESLLRSYINLISPSYGSFSPSNFLMTSSFGRYNFYELEKLLHQGKPRDAEKHVRRMMDSSKDKGWFLFEYTIPVHEKQHFFDFISTPFGLDIFWTHFSFGLEFISLVERLKEKALPIYLPLQEWKADPKCPQEVIEFVDSYEGEITAMGLFLRTGSPLSEKHFNTPIKGDLQSLIIDIDGLLRPYVCIRQNSTYSLYPLDATGIMESLAWKTQNHVMGLLNKSLAIRWNNRFLSDPSLWIYYSALQAANYSCNADPDKVVKLLQFSLMTPPSIIRDSLPNVYVEELDPAWRFHLFSEFLLSNASTISSIESAVEKFCSRYKWTHPIEIIEKTYAEISKTLAELPTDDGVFETVFKEYLEFQLQTLQLRRDYPLLDLAVLLEDHHIRPPIHRKVYPNGEVQLRVSESHASSQAWVHFSILNHLIIEMMDKKQLSCWIAHKKPVTIFPGSDGCLCELSLQKCLTAAILNKLGVDIIMLSGK